MSDAKALTKNAFNHNSELKVKSRKRIGFFVVLSFNDVDPENKHFYQLVFFKQNDSCTNIFEKCNKFYYVCYSFEFMRNQKWILGVV